MTDHSPSLSTLYPGWHTYQTGLIAALKPLSPDQLSLRAGPSLRPVRDMTTHIIGARARWFCGFLGENDSAFASHGMWDRPGQPVRSAHELVAGLEATWQGMQAAMARWTPADWQQVYPGFPGGPARITVPWVIWHIIEHDLHHGGEIGITLGSHGIRGLDI